MKTPDTKSEKDPRAPGKDHPSRRKFLAATGGVAGAAVAGMAFPSVTFGAPDTRKLKIGLIGCGGRGTGAANQALMADSNTVVSALADAFPDPIEKSLQTLVKYQGERIDVPPSRQFAGMDAFERLLETDVDVVLLATPPGFRPMHYRACIEAGKHVFAEKPVAVDAPGVRSVMETNKLAEEKGLSVLSGLCWRYETNMQDIVKRVQDGAIGNIVAGETLRYGAGVGKMVERQDGWSDMYYQMRNWYYYTWLSGDFLVEQSIHELDKMAWVFDEYPSSVIGTGGRISRTGPEYGHIYDNFSGFFEYESGRRLYFGCRHQKDCTNLSRDQLLGTEGFCDMMQFTMTGKTNFRSREPRTVMHELEHVHMYEKLRKAEYFNNGDYMAKSTLMGIMAREAAYSGKRITWEEMMTSTLDYSPPSYDWDQKLPEPTVAIPGTWDPFKGSAWERV